MPTIRDQILDDLVATLEGITTANGYSVDIGEVSREPEHWTDTKRFPACYIMEDIENPNLAEVEGFNDCQWKVGVLAYVKHRSLLSTEIEKFIGDIKKIILVDERRSTLAIDTIIDEIRNVSLWLKDIGIFEVDLTIEYRYEVTP